MSGASLERLRATHQVRWSWKGSLARQVSAQYADRVRGADGRRFAPAASSLGIYSAAAAALPAGLPEPFQLPSRRVQAPDQPELSAPRTYPFRVLSAGWRHFITVWRCDRPYGLAALESLDAVCLPRPVRRRFSLMAGGRGLLDTPPRAFPVALGLAIAVNVGNTVLCGENPAPLCIPLRQGLNLCWLMCAPSETEAEGRPRPRWLVACHRPLLCLNRWADLCCAPSSPPTCCVRFFLQPPARCCWDCGACSGPAWGARGRTLRRFELEGDDLAFASYPLPFGQSERVLLMAFASMVITPTPQLAPALCPVQATCAFELVLRQCHWMGVYEAGPAEQAPCRSFSGVSS